MDIRYSHPTDVFVVRACYYDDATDLVAIGGDHSVEVLLIVSFAFSTREISRTQIIQQDLLVLYIYCQLSHRNTHYCNCLVL